MASQEYSPRIKRVLKSYQSTAVNGLHGPSSFMNSESSEVNKNSCSSGGRAASSSIFVHGYKKLLQRQAALQAAETAGATACDSVAVNSVVTSADPLKVVSAVSSFSQCHSDKSYQHGASLNSSYLSSSNVKCHSNISKSSPIYVEQKDYKYPPSIYLKSVSVSSDDKCHWSDDNKLVKDYSAKCDPEELCSEKEWVIHDGLKRGGGGLPEPVTYLPNHHGGQVVGTITPPSPSSPDDGSGYGVSPPHAPPFPLVMGPADDFGDKGEVILEGEKVSCFSVGGERRLCFAQVLYTSLREFSMTQINMELTALHIYLSLCSKRQLQALKDDRDIPITAKSCGLITYSDAHRLTHALLHAETPPSDPPKVVVLPYNSITRQFAGISNLAKQAAITGQSSNHLIPNIMVSHRCFGKCRGYVYLNLYRHADSKCIQCVECLAFFTTSQFVCHAHRSLEIKTCHWGFDPANWRMYLQLASDQPLLTSEEAALPEVFLQQFKNKFDSTFLASCPKQTDYRENVSLLKDDLLYSTSKDSKPHYTSLPVPRDKLPHKLLLLNETPPILADPTHVVPLSEYQNYRHCQPNITLAPPTSHRAAATSDLPDFKKDNDCPKVQPGSYNISLSPKVPEGKVYTLCANLKDPSVPKPVDPPEGYAIVDGKGYPKNYSLVGSRDLQIISVDKSSLLANDLQIVKWDSRALKNVQVVNSSESSSACSLPKDLKIIRLGYADEKLEKGRLKTSIRRTSLLEQHKSQQDLLRRHLEDSKSVSIKQEAGDDDGQLPFRLDEVQVKQEPLACTEDVTDSERDNSLLEEAKKTSLSTVLEAESLLQSWEDRESARKIALLLRTLANQTKSDLPEVNVAHEVTASTQQTQDTSSLKDEQVQTEQTDEKDSLRAPKLRDTRQTDMEGVSSSVNLKRQHSDVSDSEKSSNFVLQAKIRSLESELEKLKSEHSICKRIRTDPPAKQKNEDLAAAECSSKKAKSDQQRLHLEKSKVQHRKKEDNQSHHPNRKENVDVFHQKTKDGKAVTFPSDLKDKNSCSLKASYTEEEKSEVRQIIIEEKKEG